MARLAFSCRMPDLRDLARRARVRPPFAALAPIRHLSRVWSVRPSGFQARPRNSHLEAREVLKRRNSEYGFGGDEEKLLKMLCAHCAIFLRHLDTRED